MAAVNPIRDPGAWDWVTISGKAVPGIPTIEGAGNPQKWDVRRGYGTSGAYIVYMGADVPSFTLHLTMWDPEHIDYYNSEIVPELLKSMQGHTALDFYAPACSEPPLSIKHVVVVDPGQLTEDDDGYWHASIKLLKYVRPKPSIAKPLPDSSEPKPTDAIQAQIAAQNSQFNSNADDVAAQTNKLVSQF